MANSNSQAVVLGFDLAKRKCYVEHARRQDISWNIYIVDSTTKEMPKNVPQMANSIKLPCLQSLAGRGLRLGEKPCKEDRTFPTLEPGAAEGTKGHLSCQRWAAWGECVVLYVCV